MSRGSRPCPGRVLPMPFVGSGRWCWLCQKGGMGKELFTWQSSSLFPVAAPLCQGAGPECCFVLCAVQEPLQPMSPLLLTPCSRCQVGLLCEQGQKNSHIQHPGIAQGVRSGNAQSCSGGKQSRGKGACEGIQLSVSINI